MELEQTKCETVDSYCMLFPLFEAMTNYASSFSPFEIHISIGGNNFSVCLALCLTESTLISSETVCKIYVLK
jgi:hypothetical protein